MSESPLSSIVEINPRAILPSGLSPNDHVSFIPMGDVSESGQWTTKQTRALRSVRAGFTAFESGDVLFAKITPCMENGKGAHALELENGIGFGSTEFHVLRAKPGNSSRFVFQLSQWRKLRKAAESKMVGSAGQKRVPRSFFDNYLLTHLDGREQNSIATILDSIDTAIRETEAIIVKLKAVKQRLLHDLLTRGIDANGELRPPQAEAPHLYKESPLGWIPKEWDAVKLAALVSSIGQGWSPDCESRPADSGSWGVLKTTAITWAGYSDQESKALPPIFKARSDLEVKAEDILITRAGPASRVGVVAYVESSREKLMISDKMYRMRTLPTELPAYIALALSSQVVQTELGRALSGMAESQTNISQAIVKELLVLRPLFEEQSAIVDRVRASEDRIREEDESLEKLKAFKAGLMDDLLTGRVRVTPLLEGTTP
jgi:type I restriction enzyme, S subunit